MNPEFWQARWQNNKIGFNQSDVHSYLTGYFSKLELASGSRVFVPLCGKSIDMAWLASQGYDVVGVELVESAVKAFFTERDILPIVIEHANDPNIKCYQGQLSGQTISIWAGDIFEITPADIGLVDAVYDRAALIALPDDMRVKYCGQVRHLSNNAPQLLITLEYDQGKRDGPPFSICEAHVSQYYAEHYNLTKLD